MHFYSHAMPSAVHEVFAISRTGDHATRRIVDNMSAHAGFRCMHRRLHGTFDDFMHFLIAVRRGSHHRHACHIAGITPHSTANIHHHSIA